MLVIFGSKLQDRYEHRRELTVLQAKKRWNKDVPENFQCCKSQLIVYSKQEEMELVKSLSDKDIKIQT